MQVCLIVVPYSCGDEYHGAGRGPDRFLEAGVVELLEHKGTIVNVSRVVRDTPFRDSASTSLADCKEIARIVRTATDNGQLPIVLAGSCDVGKGVLAGFEHSRCGVIWIDAHGDFNTPESTITGFFPGMSLAVIAGHCYRNYWRQIGDNTPISEKAILLLGVRDLDPEEHERLRRSDIQVVQWRNGKPQSDVRSSLDTLAKQAQDIYIHIDMDAFDPQLAPGVADRPVPGGLSLQDFEEIIREVTARFHVRAATLATYNPERDREETTLRTGLHVIELLAEA
jgi:arginase